MLYKPDKHTKELLDLADFMEKLPASAYNQEVVDDGCGRGCIAYWQGRSRHIKKDYIEYAHESLGLDGKTGRQLFHPDGGKVMCMGLEWRGPTPKEAAACLRELAVTGEVPASWTKNCHNP